MNTTPAPTQIAELLARSHRLGSAPGFTNYGGGNTSAKGTGIDPATGDTVELMWVKGSGGDLGTLREEGLATLRLDRVRAMTGVYPGVEREDEMVGVLEFARHGTGGAAPSIDTAMHALIDAPHVDHLHADVGIAWATAADGERLTRELFGDAVLWIPWRRPGFELALQVARARQANPRAVGCVLAGHGICSWGDTSAACEDASRWMIETLAAAIARVDRDDVFGAVLPGFEPLAPADRRARAAALAPVIRGLVSHDSRMVGHLDDDPVVLDFLSRAAHPRLAALGTSCPDHLIRTKDTPLVLDLPGTVPLEEAIARLTELHAAYREAYADFYRRHADADSPAMRGADPRVVLVPGVGMFGYGPDATAARLATEYARSTIIAMRGAEAVSSYTPISDEEKFRIEYWALEEAKLRRLPAPSSHSSRIALVTGAGSGIGRAIAEQLARAGACVVVADIDLAAARTVAESLGDADRAIAVAMDVTDADAVRAAVESAVLAFGGLDIVVNNAGLSIARPLLETTERDWQLQHDVMAKGSFLVSQAAARVLIPQQLGGDIVYISSKNAVFAGAENIAYSATKADQSHQVRLLAAELGAHGIRVNGVNPDGVVRGSGIFAGGWGASRARTYGVPEEELGAFYARRTLLGREVVPEHVADAVGVLTGEKLSRTTGMHVPVDGGVAAAFLR